MASIFELRRDALIHIRGFFIGIKLWQEGRINLINLSCHYFFPSAKHRLALMFNQLNTLQFTAWKLICVASRCWAECPRLRMP